MKRTPILLAASLLPMAQLLADPASPTNPETPNIVEIMTDDQGWNHVGYLGHPIIQTPHLDQMAAEGITFTRYYSPAANCAPSRKSLTFGRHASRWGNVSVGNVNVPPFHQPLGNPASQTTIAEGLKFRGYATAHFAKIHAADDAGMDVSLREGNNDRCVYYTGQAVQFMRDAVTAGKPFYVRLWLGAGHTKYLEDPESQDRATILGYPDLPMMPDGTTSFAYNTSWHVANTYASVATNLKGYYAEISRADDMVAWVRDTVGDLGLTHNTLVIFSSDNGGDTKHQPDMAPLRNGKAYLEEAGIRVPGVLVYPPLVTSPRTITEPVSGLDLLPTFFELAGVSFPPEELDGTSLVPALQDAAWKRPKPIPFWYVNNETLPHRRMALVGSRYKLITNLNDPTLPSGDPRKDEHELYDIVNDPGESTNLAITEPEILEQMLQEIAFWQDRVIRNQREFGMSYWGDVARTQHPLTNPTVTVSSNPGDAAFTIDKSDPTKWASDPGDTAPEFVLDLGEAFVPRSVVIRTGNEDADAISYLRVYGFNEADRSDLTLLGEQGSTMATKKTEVDMGVSTFRGYRYYLVNRDPAAGDNSLVFAEFRLTSDTLGTGGDYALYQASHSWPLPGDELPGADPDGDRIVNRFEHLLGLNPLVADPVASPMNFLGIQTGLDGKRYMVLEYPRVPEALDVIVGAEAGPDLGPGSWSGVQEAQHGHVLFYPDGRERWLMRVPVPESGNDSLFLRMTAN